MMIKGTSTTEATQIGSMMELSMKVRMRRAHTGPEGEGTATMLGGMRKDSIVPINSTPSTKWRIWKGIGRRQFRRRRGRPGRGALQRMGKTKFRRYQGRGVAALCRGQDTLMIIPTGSGKSLLFQILPMVHPGSVALVVVPLISLMQDHVQHAPPGRKLRAPTRREH